MEEQDETTDGPTQPETTQPVTNPVSTEAGQHSFRGRSMQRLYNSCVCLYLFSILSITFLAVGCIYFYPQRPEFTVCNDSLAWKSLIDGVTSMKVDADIQLLASIYNPNRIDVVLDTGHGSFHHDNAFVGTLTIPPTTIEAMAITDVLMTASFEFADWSALSIAKEFYKGILVLQLDLDMSLHIPILWNYKVQVSINDRLVEVNGESDRTLCACPTWDDTRYKKPRVQMDLGPLSWMSDSKTYSIL